MKKLKKSESKPPKPSKNMDKENLRSSLYTPSSQKKISPPRPLYHKEAPPSIIESPSYINLHSRTNSIIDNSYHQEPYHRKNQSVTTGGRSFEKSLCNPIQRRNRSKRINTSIITSGRVKGNTSTKKTLKLKNKSRLSIKKGMGNTLFGKELSSMKGFTSKSNQQAFDGSRRESSITTGSSQSNNLQHSYHPPTNTSSQNYLSQVMNHQTYHHHHNHHQQQQHQQSSLHQESYQNPCQYATISTGNSSPPLGFSQKQQYCSSTYILAEKRDLGEDNGVHQSHHNQYQQQYQQSEEERYNSTHKPLKYQSSKSKKISTKSKKMEKSNLMDRLSRGERVKLSKKEMLQTTKSRYNQLPEVLSQNLLKEKREKSVQRVKNAKEYSKVSNFHSLRATSSISTYSPLPATQRTKQKPEEESFQDLKKIKITKFEYDFEERCKLLYKIKMQTKTSLSKPQIRRERNLPCRSCPKLFYTVRELERHVRSSHLEGLSYTCTTCNYSTKERSTFLGHICKTHFGQVPFCFECDKVLPSPQALDTHLKKVHLWTECPRCSKVVIDPQGLNSHTCTM